MFSLKKLFFTSEDVENCTEPQPYWLAWGPSCLRFGRGLDPTVDELTGMCIVSPNTQTDFYVRIASDYGATANWTLYRQNEVNFTGECAMQDNPHFNRGDVILALTMIELHP